MVDLKNTDYNIFVCSETLVYHKKYIMALSPSYIFDSAIMYIPCFMRMENVGREEAEGKEMRTCPSSMEYAEVLLSFSLDHLGFVVHLWSSHREIDNQQCSQDTVL